MFLYRLMVPIFILSYFGDIKCVKFKMHEYISEPKYLEKAYLQEVVKVKLNEKKNHSICTKSITDKDKMQVLTACTATFVRLRKVYQQRFYVYYNYYETLDSLCKTGTVELYEYRTEVTYEQALIPCYIAQPIVETSFLNPGKVDIDRLPKSNLNHFDRFQIIPTDSTFSSWLVFDYNKSENKYALIKWYQTEHIKLYYIPPDLLIFPRPMKTRDMSEIYAILYPFISNWEIVTTRKEHVLHQMKSADLKNLCLKITKPKKYSTAHLDVPKITASYHPLIFKSPKAYDNRVLLGTWGYSCDVYLAEPGWFLFTAPGDDAIILGQLSHEEHGENFYSIKAYVKNVNYQFYPYVL